jgi:hypothetical protein
VRDTDAAWVATALALCLKRKIIAAGSKSGTNEDCNTPTKISRHTKVQEAVTLQSLSITLRRIATGNNLSVKWNYCWTDRR